MLNCYAWLEYPGKLEGHSVFDGFHHGLDIVIIGVRSLGVTEGVIRGHPDSRGKVISNAQGGFRYFSGVGPDPVFIVGFIEHVVAMIADIKLPFFQIKAVIQGQTSGFIALLGGILQEPAFDIAGWGGKNHSVGIEKFYGEALSVIKAKEFSQGLAAQAPANPVIFLFLRVSVKTPFAALIPAKKFNAVFFRPLAARQIIFQ